MASPAQLRVAAMRAKRAARSPLNLPPIPAGHVRLTHVTSPDVRRILEAGEAFKTRNGIDLTTDSYSSNADIEHLARTGDPMGVPESGKLSNWSRNPFGDQMVLMDVPADAHKAMALSGGAFSDPVPNGVIVGFVDRSNMAFAPNPRYSADVARDFGDTAASRIRALQREIARRPPATPVQDVPPPSPATPQTADARPEVW